jgi:hypothetical protein
MKNFTVLLVVFLLIFSGGMHDIYGYEEDWEENDPYILQEKGLRIADRTFEVGFGAGFSFTNNFLSAEDIFQRVLIIDLDKLADGLNINFGLGIVPLYFNYNKENILGFGLSTNMEVYGNIDLSGDMLTFNQAVNKQSEVSSAAFFEIGASAFFHIERFKVKIRPALYYTLMYLKPERFYYTYDNKNGETIINLDYEMRLYSGFTLDDAFEMIATPGFDFSVGIEYPLAKAIGLKSKYKILDFDVGLDLINIPLFPSVMNEYTEIIGRIGDDKPLDLFGEDGGFDFPNMDEDPIVKEEKIDVFRPFKMLVWAHWRPLEGELLTVIPTIGFAVNPFYLEPLSFEGGLSARLDIANIFITTLGVNFTDRLWKNSIDVAINFRAFELNLGFDIRAADFAESWKGSGTGFNVGFKFGW